MTLAGRLEEVEADTPDAFMKRRELVRLLVTRIVTGRDEDDQIQVQITYRFGPQEEDAVVSGVQNVKRR
jgi:hypothetical protein